MHYRVRIDPRARQLELDVELERAAAGDLVLHVPTWVPGAYAFMKYGRDVFDVRAEDAATGASLVVRREGMSGLAIDAAPRTLVVRARVTASDPAWGELVGVIFESGAIVRATHFPFDPAHQGPCRVSVTAPPGWAIHPPSGARAVGDDTYELPSFAALVDSPIAVGTFEHRTRTLRGVTFHHVFMGRAVGFEREVEHFLDQVMAVSAATADVFGGVFPFAEYTYVYATDPRASWGLESAHSTLVGIGDGVFIDDEERRAAIRLVAHELFHAWNVCRLRPRALMQPDLVQGSFPDGLWISEGITRYYELLLATRVGALSAARMLSNLVRYDRALRALPATRHTTLVDSSLATFLNHNRYPGAASATIDYYDKGMVVAFAIDACLRTAARPSSLDDAFRAFYEAFHARGFGTSDAIAFFDEYAAPLGPIEPLGALLERCVRGAEMPDIVAWLARLGVTSVRAEVPHLGMWLARDRGPAIVDVVEGSPAAEAGLGAGDEIVGQAGYAFRPDALAWLVRHEASFDVEIQSGHVRRAATVRPSPHSIVSELSLPDGGAGLVSWLGPGAADLLAGAHVVPGHYDNFHARESML